MPLLAAIWRLSVLLRKDRSPATFPAQIKWEREWYVVPLLSEEARRRVSNPIVLACDDAFAMPLATALGSIAEANRSSWPLEVYVLSSRTSENTRRKVFDSLPKDSTSIHWADVDLTLFDGFAEFWANPHLSKIAYARLLIPSIIPHNVPRVLYLDSDLLVLDELGPLWETDLEGAVLGAVMDRLDWKLKSGKPDAALSPSEVDVLSLMPHVREYFNSGVLLIDLDRWRNERISEKALEYLSRHPGAPFPDQDALNVACDGRWKKLDPRWNFQDHYRTKISDLRPERRPAIIHFVTSRKPWDPSACNVNADFYDAYRSRTCFARTTRERFWDVFKAVWSRSKGVLKRWAFVQVIWSRVSPHLK